MLKNKNPKLLLHYDNLRVMCQRPMPDVLEAMAAEGCDGEGYYQIGYTMKDDPAVWCVGDLSTMAARLQKEIWNKFRSGEEVIQEFPMGFRIHSPKE